MCVALDVGWLVMVVMMKRVRRETVRLLARCGGGFCRLHADGFDSVDRCTISFFFPDLSFCTKAAIWHRQSSLKKPSCQRHYHNFYYYEQNNSPSPFHPSVSLFRISQNLTHGKNSIRTPWRLGSSDYSPRPI